MDATTLLETLLELQTLMSRICLPFLLLHVLDLLEELPLEEMYLTVLRTVDFLDTMLELHTTRDLSLPQLPLQTSWPLLMLA